MTDLPEDTWMNREQVTHADLEAETATVMKTLAREMEKVRDQLYHLNKTHTICLMAAEIFTRFELRTPEMAAREAKALYREVQKTLEIDRQITGHIT